MNRENNLIENSKEQLELLEGIIRIPEGTTKEQFYKELSDWICERGGDYKREYVSFPRERKHKLEIQFAQHMAVFNKGDNKVNRYTLRVDWNMCKKKVAILMMNPSHATALHSDETVKFMIQYVTHHFDAGQAWIVNISSYIQPKSCEVGELHFRVDEINKTLIKQAIEWAEIVFLAWGDKGGTGVKAYGEWFKRILVNHADKLRCFRQSKKGNPIHRNQRPRIDLDHIPQDVDLQKIFKDT